ncbi:hypothetical protein DEU56DRAFT_934815 [Suillus clintonianus]|uniref:uncharacterized protein n=1 Tax=Suillus clintonianus TaxID=1904413 RepID=UPI001B88006C|nr:uncharacterized protein DEU56DRAFT_934815 [Suillus clintonianus]KAG2145254.1 hypothetical protein DEU56DRAFT_934815 [Suillus clintonianus]
MTTLNQFTVFWEAARSRGIVTSGPDIPPLRLSDQTKHVSSLAIIEEVSGIFDHSSACEAELEMDHDPRIPLHPDLREFALALLCLNTPLTQLQEHCRGFAKQKWGDLAGDTHARYMLTSHDSTSLYRTIAREIGIPQRSAAEANLDSWFRTNDPHPPDPALSHALMFYQAHVDGVTDRCILIFSTPEQRALAWKYGHNNQVLMDGTFAKAVHADYDQKILEDVLDKWKAAMGLNDAGEPFNIAVGNTDNDIRERYALTKHWPSIHLILCLFHMWQSWRNGLNRYLKPAPKGPARQEIRARLEAVHAYNEELAFFRDSAGRMMTYREKNPKLAYLFDYLKLRSFWLSWSPGGVLVAAERLGVPMQEVIRTNNHLESFNCRLKKKFFAHYMHSGRLPHVDYWVLLMITRVIPDFLTAREDRQKLADYYRNMRRLSDEKPDMVPTEPADEIPPLFDAKKMLNDLDNDDELDDDESAHDSDEPDAQPGLEALYTGGLHISDDGNSLTTCKFPCTTCNHIPRTHFHAETPPETEFHDSNSFLDDGFALDSDAIMCDLSDDIGIPPPSFDSGSSDGLSLLLDPVILTPCIDHVDIPAIQIFSPGPLAAQIPSTTLSNEQAIIYQECLALEDAMLDCFRRLLTISFHSAPFEPHMSPAVRGRLTNTPLLLPISLPPSPSALASTSRLGDVVIGSADNHTPHRLQPFALQKKELRKESHGVR